MEVTIEELLKKVQDGDKEALKQVIEYYKNNDDEEMANYFEGKLKEVLELETAKEDASTDENAVEEDSANTEEKTSSDSETIKEETEDKDDELKEETKDDEVEPEVADDKPQNEAKFVSYDKLSTAELKEKAENNDPKACLELAKKYLKDNQTNKAEELLNLAIETLKNDYENCTEEDLECLFYCYETKASCYKNGTEERFLALQNAVEVPCNEKNKGHAYLYLASEYRNYKNDKLTYEKYLLKAGRFSKDLCLEAAISYQLEGNNVDYEDWLERAEKMQATTPFEEEVVPLIIKIKKECKNGELILKDCEEYFSILNDFPRFPAMRDFARNEIVLIIEKISEACSKYGENAELNDDNLNLHNVCIDLLNDKEGNPSYYENINLTKIEDFFVRYALLEIEKDNITFYINSFEYNKLRKTLIDDERIDILNKIKEQEEVKEDHELEKLVASDIEEVSSNINRRQEMENRKRLAEEEKIRKQQEEAQREREYAENQRRQREAEYLQRQEQDKRITKYLVIGGIVIFLIFCVASGISLIGSLISGGASKSSSDSSYNMFYETDSSDSSSSSDSGLSKFTFKDKSLTGLNVVDSDGYDLDENVTTALGTTLEEAISLSSSYTSSGGYVEYRLGGSYKAITLDVIAAAQSDNNVFQAYGDDLELDKKIIHLRDSSAYTVTLNVEGVDILRLKVRNGHIYISNTTLYTDNSKDSECLVRTDKISLFDMYRMENSNDTILKSYYTDYKGQEHCTIIKGDDCWVSGEDYQWSETYNLNSEYSQFSGTIVTNSAVEEHNGIFQVYLDGNLAYSYVVRPNASDENFNISVSGCNIIQIKYVPDESNTDSTVISMLLDNAYLQK